MDSWIASEQIAQGDSTYDAMPTGLKSRMSTADSEAGQYRIMSMDRFEDFAKAESIGSRESSMSNPYDDILYTEGDHMKNSDVGAQFVSPVKEKFNTPDYECFFDWSDRYVNRPLFHHLCSDWMVLIPQIARAMQQVSILLGLDTTILMRRSEGEAPGLAMNLVR
jgi:hypothetical protein